MAKTLKLPAPQFLLLTELVQPRPSARLNMQTLDGKGEGWIQAPYFFRKNVAKALVQKNMAELTEVRGCPYMRATPLGVTHWNTVNTKLRAK